MCCTSPLGLIIQEGQEVEISVSAVQNSADIYASGPGLSAESAWTRPRHILEQSETMAGVTQTDVNMAEAEMRPQLPTLDQGCKQPEVGVAKEMIDVAGIETDPVKVYQIIMDYAENLNRQNEPTL